jgi:hypothetical protein
MMTLKEKMDLVMHFRSKAGLKNHLRDGLLREGYDANEADQAAAACAAAVFSNAQLAGAATTLIMYLASPEKIASPLLAGAAVGTIAGMGTLLTSRSCRPFNAQYDLDRAVNELVSQRP